MEEFFSTRCAAGHPMQLGSSYYGCPECRPPAERTGIRRLMPSLGWVKGAGITLILVLAGLFIGAAAGGVLEAASAWVPGLM